MFHAVRSFRSVAVLVVLAAAFPARAQLAILDTALPVGVVARPYATYKLTASGGAAPYTFSIAAGALAPGLALAANGTLSGTPGGVFTGSVTFQVLDGVGGTATRTISHSVVTPPVPASWTPRASYGGPIGEITLSPNYLTDNTLFTVAADRSTWIEEPSGEVFRSTDRGATWSRFPVDPAFLNAQLDRVVLAPTYNQSLSGAAATALVVMGGAIYKSVDHGATWAKLANPGGYQTVYTVAFHPAFASNATLYALMRSPSSLDLYRSTTGGTSWSFLGTVATTGINGGAIALSPTFATDPIFLVATGYYLYRSTTGASGSWTAVGPTNLVRTDLAFSPNFSTDQTVMFNSTGVYRSTDKGVTWTATGKTVKRLAPSRVSASLVRWWARLSDGPEKYAVAASDDAGATFVPVYAANHRSIAANDGGGYGFTVGPTDTGGATEVFYGSAKGLDRSADSGFTFAPVDTGLTTAEILAIDGRGDTVFATTREGWLKSIDGGATWTWYDYVSAYGQYGFLFMTNVAVSPDFANDHTVWMSEWGQSEYVSRDGGRSWQSSDIAGNSAALNEYAFTPNFSAAGAGTGRMFVAGSDLYTSTDSRYFTPVGMPAACPGPLASIQVSPGYATDHAIFAGAANGAVCRSVDDGANWTVLATLAKPPVLRLSPDYLDSGANGSSRRTLFATSNDYTNAYAMRSTDGGATWTAIGGVPSGTSVYAVFTAHPSPAFPVDGVVFISALAYNSSSNGGLWRSADSGATAARLGAADGLKARSVNGLYLPPTFTGGGSSPAVAGAVGTGFWRSADSGQSFQATPGYRGLVGRITGAAIAGDTSTAPPAGALLLLSDEEGVLRSDSDGAAVRTFNDINAVTGLPYRTPLALWMPCRTNATPGAPVLAVAGNGLYRYTKSFVELWAPVSGFTAGDYVRFTEDAQYVYAARADGLSIRSADCGATWAPISAAEAALVWVSSINEPIGPTAPPPIGEAPAVAVTAPLWGVAAAAGPRWSADSGSNWTAAPGGNDYALPGGLSWSVVQPLGLNAASGGREVVAGTTTGLWRTLDGGATWRSVSGAGSGLEATTRNFSAVLTAPTGSGTDLLVGITGATTGGVYLSGDGGEHWTQVNQGFDPNSLSISTLVKTSCAGCPVQYYSGSFGGGLYTRTIAVTAPPALAVNYACWGSTGCTCGATAGSGTVAGGQAFKLCGSNFQAGVTVEFDGIPAGGCTQSGGTVITCTATPAHVTGYAAVRVRNPDTRTGYLPAQYHYTGGTSRTANTLRVAKSGANAALNWTCSGCSAGNPGRLYRAQNAGFSTYLEQYNVGTGSSFTNSGAMASGQSYFWSVE